MIDLGKTVFNVVFLTCAGKDMLKGEFVFFPVCELNAIVCQNGVDFIGNGLNELIQECDRLHLSSRCYQFAKSEF